MMELVALWNRTKDGLDSFHSMILYSDWAKTVVTICTALLRACMSIQLVICCKMMATLAFEKNCVLLCDAASMSIYRYSVSFPWSMAHPVFRGVRVSKKFGVAFLVVSLSSVMALSQFLSAILLHDLGHDYVRGPKFEKECTRRVGGTIRMGQLDPLFLRPQSFPRFAEQTGRSISISENSTGRGLRDTGATVRAFPELRNASERASLLYYRGYGGVSEEHVVCVSPDIEELIYVEPDRITGRLSSEFLFNSTSQMESVGSFRWNRTQPSSDLVFNFNCTLGDAFGVMICPLEAPVSINCPGFPTPCLLSSTNAWFLLIIEDSYPWTDYGGQRIPHDPAVTRKLYSQATYFDGTELARKAMYHTATDIPPPGRFPWTRKHVAGMSLCAVGTANAMATIEAQADWMADEPTYGLYGVTTDYTGRSAEAVIAQLSSGSDLEGRGVMDLITYEIGEGKPFTDYIRRIRGHIPSIRLPYQPDGRYDSSVMMAERFGELAVAISYAVNNKGQITSKLQSVLAAYTSREFYAQLEITPTYFANLTSFWHNGTMNFYPYENATQVMQCATEAIVPERKIGLYIASGIVGLHIASVVVVFWMYYVCKAPKFLDQAWQTIAQLNCGPEAQQFLEESCDKGDLDVGRLPAAAEHWGRIVEIRDFRIAVKATGAEVHGKSLNSQSSFIERSNGCCPA